MTSLRRAGFSLWIASAALAAACSTSSSPGEPGGGGNTAADGGLGGGGTCPCEVGNGGIRVTLGCGDSQCISLNGQVTGVRCTAQGAVQDQTVCTNPPPPPNYDAGPCGRVCAAPETCGGGGVPNFCGCTPKSCAELNGCGTIVNDCNAEVQCPACGGETFCAEAGKCIVRADKVIVIGNREGGTFAIHVDQDIPNLAIGLVSRNPMHVTIAGAFAANVVAVAHAGYDRGTTVEGVPATKVMELIMPSVDPDGGFGTTISEDGPMSIHPTNAEIAAYFVRYFGGAGELLYHQCQREAYTSTLQVSSPGTCQGRENPD